MQRLLNFLITVDQCFFSVVTLGKSSPDETMSAAAWRLERDGRWAGRVFRPLIDGLFFFDPDHCRLSFESERNGSQLPSQYQVQEGP